MGNGLLSGFSHNESFNPQQSPILNPYIRNLAPLLPMDDELRGCFVNFVASGMWLTDFLRMNKYHPAETNFEIYADRKNAVDNVHISHLRYELPSGELFPTACHTATNKVVVAIANAEIAQKNFLLRQFTKHRMLSMIKRHRSPITPDSLQNIICAVLMSSFVDSADFRQWYEKNQKILIMNEQLAFLVNQEHEDGSMRSLIRKSVQAVMTSISLGSQQGDADAVEKINLEDYDDTDDDHHNTNTDPSNNSNNNDHRPEHTEEHKPEEKVREEEALQAISQDTGYDFSVLEKNAANVSAKLGLPVYKFSTRSNSTFVSTKLRIDEDRQEDLEQYVPGISFYETLLVQTVAKVDMLKLTDTLTSDLWLREVLRYLETLPVAISISDARQTSNILHNNNTNTSNIHNNNTNANNSNTSNISSNSGRESFPLIYVNRAYEKLTGYHREEMLGRNCRFLQTEERTERQQIQRISTALQQGVSLKLALTNVKKDGSSFLNFLALKPVFSRDNQYAYVIGISYDLAIAKMATGRSSLHLLDTNSNNNHTNNGNNQTNNSSSTSSKYYVQAADQQHHWWQSHSDEHDALIEDLEEIDALLRLLPMLLV